MALKPESRLCVTLSEMFKKHLFLEENFLKEAERVWFERDTKEGSMCVKKPSIFIKDKIH